MLRKRLVRLKKPPTRPQLILLAVLLTASVVSATDNGDGTWKLSFDIDGTDTQDLEEGEYEWSVEFTDDNGNKFLLVYNAEDQKADLIDRHI